jgi:tRNA-Thr(GGU) m(6)t(6)A37 methyltransferase TsaA
MREGGSRTIRSNAREAANSMFTVIPIGHVTSPLARRDDAPKQGHEGAPDAWLVFEREFQEGLRDLRVGQEVLVLTWLDRSDRQTLSVHPRGDQHAALRGVFSTRSPDRPNPVGIHRVRLVEIESPTRFKVRDLEALDGTPIIDLKPVLDRVQER